jgi:RNA polymerase sigma factor (sigma-70 family)
MMQVEELQIMEQIRYGNANAFSELVKKYQNVVFSIALKILRNREDAEEIAQETFIKAYRSIHTFQGKSKFSTWLFRITYNTCITEVRKKRFPTSSIDQVQVNEVGEEGNFGEFQEEDRAKYLEMALKELAEDDYMLIILYYYQEQSVADISQVTGLSESNIKVKLHRARNKLYSILNDLMKKEAYS